jgi:hypothetical protein
MNQRQKALLIGHLAVAVLLLAACGPAATPAPVETEAPTAAPTTPPEPTAIPWTPPEGALVSIPVDEAPTLDGTADEAVWGDAPAITIPVSGGANMGSTEVTLRSVYVGDMVYFTATYSDPTESFLRAPWVKQEDGTWAQLHDPNDGGGDNNLYYEDKMAFIWPIGNSIPNFETQGCFTVCHAGENSDVKAFGNKYTAGAGQRGDIWHWKSVRNLNQIDDQYVDDVRYSAETPEAGRHGDPKDAGGYVNNRTENGTTPAFMQPADAPRDGSPGYILDAEKLPFDDAVFASGDMVPAIIISEFTGDRGDITAAWQWADGAWTLEFGRLFVTGSEFDVQFDDLTATYFFGVAVFDNAQVRHAFETGATPFVFQP